MTGAGSADRRAGAVPALLVVLTVLLGAPAGVVWTWLAPRVAVAYYELGPGFVEFESSQFFDVDRAYVWVTMTLGVLSGVAAWLAGRRRGPWVPVALVGGCLLAATVAREVGERAVVDERLRAYCTDVAYTGFCEVYDGHNELRTSSFTLAWPFVAVAAFGVLTLVADREDHDEDGDPAGTVPPS